MFIGERLIQEFQNKWAQRDRELTSHIYNILKQQALDGQISLIEQQKQFLSHAYQKASAYTNLIILAGYAGIFAIWQQVRDVLSKNVIIWVALLTSSSLIIFVAYEVWKMISEALFLQRVNKIIEQDISLQNRLSVWSMAFKEHARFQSKIWIFFLAPAVLLGFSAAFILIFQFIRELI